MRLLAMLLATMVAGCGSSAGPTAGPDLRILFIGNSLTYVNDLPALVQRLGSAAPARNVVVSSVAYPDYSLLDHWDRGDAQRAIADDGPWDLVVLQQGPSALPESRVELIDYATRFAGEIRRAGARPAIYMVWPPLDRAGDWDAVTESYAAAADAVDGTLFPAGEALRSAYMADRTIQLFAGDDFHPALAGSWTAALVIYARAAAVSPIGLTQRAGGIELPADHIPELEQAAAEAIARFSGE